MGRQTACANRAGHGHRYRVETTLGAAVDRDRPTVAGRRAIRRLIDDVLAAKLDHADMNTAFGADAFISTGENVTREIWKTLEPHVPDDATLVCVRVVETPKNSFAYYGEDGVGPPMA